MTRSSQGFSKDEYDERCLAPPQELMPSYAGMNFIHHRWTLLFTTSKSIFDPKFWRGRSQLYCRVTPYRLENLSLLLHTSETRSLPRIAVKRWIAKRAKMRKDAQRRPKTRKQKILKLFFWKLAKLTEEVAGARVGYRKTHKIQTLKPYISLFKILLILFRIGWLKFLNLWKWTTLALGDPQDF